MSYLFNCLLKTTIISSIYICLLLLLKTCLFKIFNKKFNYYIWLIVILRMLFFFLNYSIDFTKEISKNYALIDNFTNLNNKINPTLDVSFYILLIWIIGAIVSLSHTLCKYLKFNRLVIDTSFEIEDVHINDIYKNLLLELNIKKNIPLKYTEELDSPACMGLFNTYILLLDFQYQEDKIYWILKHELTHFKNKDILIKFLVLFAKSLFWFNPLVYIMSNKISEDCELCCDESVLNNCTLREKKKYGLALLHAIELSHLNKAGLLTTEFSKSNLEIRLENITKKKGRNGVLIGILVFITLCTSFLEINAQTPILENIPTVNKENTENNGHSFTETIDYTYATAPEKYRKRYEESCKASGITPRDSDVIEVPKN
ncbi:MULTISPECIES: M56 family metallopeptidase [unclassified Clostridioides]|uniref:M56 family metallopeptidase n=1 Tax=unclassified Clostridioides TaxID=2635829 RepID=UPI001D1179F5|nr:protease [Clostridioides sp. ES-S-0171-01]MCC0686669.1 protease [Clostridioides sp. ES-S-0056-01]MCC0713814.1 protease [Clostridioides sp. ES-S-0077-01]UDN55248.1 protease [Clostridioides sp. ES-S-0054-01]